MKQSLKDFLDRRESWESLFKAIPEESIFVQNDVKEPSNKDSDILRSFCRMCHGGCGTLVHVSKGRVRKVEGDPEHPMNLGSLCTKGVSSIQQLYSPYRLHYPLKRVGKRGEGKWKRVSWEEALDFVAQEMVVSRASSVITWNVQTVPYRAVILSDMWSSDGQRTDAHR